jgi:hypothetical protein
LLLLADPKENPDEAELLGAGGAPALESNPPKEVVVVVVVTGADETELPNARAGVGSAAELRFLLG